MGLGRRRRGSGALHPPLKTRGAARRGADETHEQPPSAPSRACIMLSIARSLATEIVSPSGSNDACETHDATIAERALLCAAVTM